MKRALLLCTLLSVLLGSTHVYAGKLEDFEEDAETRSSRGTYSSKRSSDSGFFEFLFDVFVEHLILATGRNSLYKARSTITEEEHSYLSPRAPGDPQVPFFKLALSGGDLESDIQLQNYFAEAGYGAFSVTYEHAYFSERHPRDTLRLETVLFNYRMTFWEGMQVDIGLGELSLKGERERSDAAFSLRLQLMKKRGMGLEYQFLNTAGKSLTVKDHQLNLLYNFPFWSLRAGYRLVDGGTESLKGPVLGLSFQY